MKRYFHLILAGCFCLSGCTGQPAILGSEVGAITLPGFSDSKTLTNVPDLLHREQFEYWKSINSNVTSVVSIPFLDIEYPVLQSKESNTEWLRTNIYGSYDIYGSVFLDYRTSYDSTIRMIHGHNSKNGKYFSNLEVFLGLSSCEESPAIYLYDTDSVDVYYAFAVLSLDSKEETINFPKTTDVESVYYFCKTLQERSVIEPAVPESSDILLLNSCWYGEYGEERNLKCIVAAYRDRGV